MYGNLVRHRWMLAALLMLAVVSTQTWGLYLAAQIEKVPVARLVENLQTKLQKDPKDVETRFNLARLHAMAYALKTDTAELNKNQQEQGAWFGYEPRPIPFEVKKISDAGKQDAARKQLEKAIQRYAEVVKAKPENLLFAAMLGHAWCVEQDGNKEQAMKEYRALIEQAWNVEKDMQAAPLGWHPITAEAGRYLTALLDKEKDKAEIDRLKERAEQLGRIPRPVTPIAIPLRDGLSAQQMLNPQARVRFDADGTALPHEWTWITAEAAWLVHDPKQTGKITSTLQLFGNVTFWCFWENGYAALAALDDNHDGQVEGKELAGLALWHDRNGNGISDAGEVRPLADWNIVSLSCRGQTSRESSHAAFATQGVRFKDGRTRPTYDLILNRR